MRRTVMRRTVLHGSALWPRGFPDDGTDSRRRSALLSLAVLAAALLATCTTRAQSTHDGGRLRLRDVTAAAGIGFRQTIGDTVMSNLVEAAGVGCAFLDFDGDGALDLFLVNGCWQRGISDPKLPAAARVAHTRASDRLYRNRGDGTFEDVTERAGVLRPALGMGVTVADVDGDGDPDIYVTNYGPNFLWRNRGDGTFEEVAKQLGIADPGFSLGAAFFDYDRDGVLDLYVGNYVEFDPDYDYYYAPDGFPGPLAYAGQQDRLYHGLGKGAFEDVTARAGIETEPRGRAMGVGAADFDGDGLVDVFVANDAMENYLFRNRGDGTFEESALLAGVAYGESGEATAAMAVEVADYDGDGRFDVLVPDMRYSCLYHNLGDGAFEERSAPAGIAAVSGQYVSWGCAFADLDLDGFLDAYIANGDLHHLEAQEDLLLLGTESHRFRDVTETSGDWSHSDHVSRGVAAGDIDNDGDLDLLVASLDGAPVLLRNELDHRDRHWLGVQLVGRAPATDAIGARVECHLGKRVLVRGRIGGGGYLSQHDSRLHLGLGSAARVDRLVITWPGGKRQVIESPPIDGYLTVREGVEQ